MNSDGITDRKYDMLKPCIQEFFKDPRGTSSFVSEYMDTYDDMFLFGRIFQSMLDSGEVTVCEDGWSFIVVSKE